jgi:hypothetical protein
VVGSAQLGAHEIPVTAKLSVPPFTKCSQQTAPGQSEGALHESSA